MLDTNSFAELILASRIPEGAILERLRGIHGAVLAQSPYLREANFMRIHTEDLGLLFALYDTQYFGGRCREALPKGQLRFRLSTRMTKAGGKTTRFRSASGEVWYEIAIACGLLFESFGAEDRLVTVCGCSCTNRLEALQRIFEHELVHLIEYLCFDESECSKPRFHDIAARHFLHRTPTHQLITRRERAANGGIRPGSRVDFLFEGLPYTGIVNRITKRATVLVEDPTGQLFSNGLRYRAYYVPLEFLKPDRTSKQIAIRR
jgi:hypothetical protein